MFTTTKALRQAAAAAHAERTPLIKFVGKRTIPASIDHTPHAHPASPTNKLPPDFGMPAARTTFSSYRDDAQQHGPLGKSPKASVAPVVEGDGIGSHSGRQLGSVEPAKGEVWDRSQLPKRFWRRVVTAEEMEAIELGGASLVS